MADIKRAKEALEEISMKMYKCVGRSKNKYDPLYYL